ncbi:MAG: LptE family protein [Cyclobacteriaceae bacterium]|nr:LptE family protein [Cyclobacteriaceae bacterium]
MNLKIRTSISFVLLLFIVQGCGVYSLSGASTKAKTIEIDQFFNNTDLGPANLGPTFTNRLRDYYQQNSQLKIVSENGELHVEGIIAEYRFSNVAPVSTGNPNEPNYAALSRLTIVVKVTYEDTTEPTNNFKDQSFSFYRDFDNSANFTAIQEDLEKRVIDQILILIFNATVANW